MEEKIILFVIIFFLEWGSGEHSIKEKLDYKLCLGFS